MKKIIIILFVLLLTGCTDYVEINDLAIVTGVLVDYKDNKYEITSQLVINENESIIKTFTTKGDSIEEAFSEISKLSNKELFLSHLKILLITDNIIKNNINYYEYFLRESKSKMNYYVYLVDEKISKDILLLEENKDGSALYIDSMMEFNSKIFSSSTPLEFIDMMHTIKEPGITVIYPSISIIENNNKKVLYLDNLITYNKNQEKTILNEKQSIIYNILTNKSKKTVIDVECDNGLFTLTLEDINTKFDWKDNNFIIDTNINSKVITYECEYNLSKKENIEKLNKITEKYLTKEINSLLEIIKSNDFIGIENYIYKHDYKFYNKWDKNLNNLNIIVKTNNKIESTGELRKGEKNGKSQ